MYFTPLDKGLRRELERAMSPVLALVYWNNPIMGLEHNAYFDARHGSVAASGRHHMPKGEASKSDAIILDLFDLIKYFYPSMGASIRLRVNNAVRAVFELSRCQGHDGLKAVSSLLASQVGMPYKPSIHGFRASSSETSSNTRFVDSHFYRAFGQVRVFFIEVYLKIKSAIGQHNWMPTSLRISFLED
ncbi:hypothetical protein B0H19DRAFT_1059894 [Mycena capillaripes]|nr:hypothetical protein B0H19DRAFT_1059894 [Mycena capillaripes]